MRRKLIITIAVLSLVLIVLLYTCVSLERKLASQEKQNNESVTHVAVENETKELENTLVTEDTQETPPTIVENTQPSIDIPETPTSEFATTEPLLTEPLETERIETDHVEGEGNVGGDGGLRQ